LGEEYRSFSSSLKCVYYILQISFYTKELKLHKQGSICYVMVGEYNCRVRVTEINGRRGLSRLCQVVLYISE
jgi:hypothetical protein